MKIVPKDHILLRAPNKLGPSYRGLPLKAVVWTLNKFRTWFFGVLIVIYSNSNLITYITSNASKSAKLTTSNDKLSGVLMYSTDSFCGQLVLVHYPQQPY